MLEEPVASKDSTKSSRREKLIEHVFVGDLMRTLWVHDIDDLDVLRPETDASGFDMVLELAGVTRHVQLKASARDARTSRQCLQLALGTKPSGCVIWVQFDRATMQLGPFLWLGNAPKQPLPDISGLPRGRHSRGKKERANVRIVNKGEFVRLSSMEELANQLFGLSLPPPSSKARTAPNPGQQADG